LANKALEGAQKMEGGRGSQVGMTGRAAHLEIFSGAKKCLKQWNEHMVKYVAKLQNIGFFGKLM